MHIYALDIETCTDGVNGLDPSESHITSIAVHDGSHGVVFDGSEEAILVLLERHLKMLPEGIIVTWNGAAFDMPWLADRFAIHGVKTSLNIVPSDERVPSYNPIPGHDGGYLASWGVHDHVDVMLQYRLEAKADGRRHGLKAVARHYGIDVIEVDRENMHLLTVEEEHAYVLSDVNATHILASRILEPILAFWSDRRQLALLAGDCAA
ncbi:MAG: hypothetical protein GY882_11650 [Actinomycetia bacterium]|nr:hypothetical protein [Actinomycetes bacterium]MCP4845805.1 hypothetical protein [Actinomycetes bacterium]